MFIEKFVDLINELAIHGVRNFKVELMDGKLYIYTDEYISFRKKMEVMCIL